MRSGSKTFLRPDLCALVAQRLDWQRWEGVIAERGLTVDRARGDRHPDHSSIIYPIDYGYVNGTLSTDGHGLDVFDGTAVTGLVGAVAAIDYRRGDTELKLIYNCGPEEIYLVNGFINFDRMLMEGVLLLRVPMASIRAVADSSSPNQ